MSDRWSASSWLPVGRRQVCWAQLIRDFQALVDWGGAATPVGTAALALIDDLFAAWHRARDAPARRDHVIAEVAPIQTQFKALLEAGATNPAGKTGGLCRNLLKRWPALWTFVTVPGGEPTHHTAERALRPAVRWRKGSFGTQRDGGARLVERMRSVAATGAHQERPLLDDLVAVCTAGQRGHAIPGLLPESPPVPIA